MTNSFLPYSVQLLTGGGTNAWINQIESATPDAGIELFEETSGSEIDRQFVATKQIVPMIPISTSDLTLVTTVGNLGVFITPDTDAPGAVIYGRLLPLGSAPSAIGNSDHLAATVSDGLLVPVSITAGHNEPAKFAMQLHPIQGANPDSGVRPIIWAASQTITSGAGSTQNIYGAGPCKYTISGGASRLVTGDTQIRVDFGIQLFKDSTDSNVYPDRIAIKRRMSRIEFTTTDVELITEVNDGLALSAFAGYFRQVAADGQRIAPATATHVKVSATAGVLRPGSVNFTHLKSGEASFTFTPRFNSSAQLSFSATSAIPTS